MRGHRRHNTVVKIVISLFVVGIALSVSTPVIAAESAKARVDRIRREHDRRVAEMRRKAALNKSNSKPSSTSTSRTTSRPSIDNPQSSSVKVPPFEPSAAPSPQECYAKYVITVRTATTMTPVLPFLRTAERDRLQREQDQWDPKKTRETLNRLHREGKIDAKHVELMSMSPFERELQSRKGFVDDILSIARVSVDGDRAKIVATIRTNAKVNGRTYTRSSTTIGLVGEGRFWYYQTYKQSSMVTN